MSDRIQIKGIGELIAAVPTVLSFVPEQSIVLVFSSAGRVTWMVRTDFGTGGRLLTAETIVRSGESDAVIVVVVAKGRTFREVMAEGNRVSATMLGLGVEVQGIYYTPSIEGGQTWTDMQSFETGTVVDPATTAAAAATVFTGKQLTRTREEIVARYRRDGATTTDRRRARMTKEVMGRTLRAASSASWPTPSASVRSRRPHSQRESGCSSPPASRHVMRSSDWQ
nr:DUF4192 family protein [Rhodococcus zopfii]